MGMDWVADVAAFHDKFEVTGEPTPGFPPEERIDRRLELLGEEVRELCVALDGGDLVEVADALADITYVVIGMGLTFGIDLRPVWDEVHKTNMAKVSGGAGKKVVKPEGWTAPDVAGILVAQGWGRGGGEAEAPAA